MALERMPRYRLAHLPTPLEGLPHLSKTLGGPRILVKRDDLTGLAFGGNKTRKLEFLFGDALQRGADTVITAGAPQSNHCRQTAAAACKAGLRCVLLFSPGHHDELQGNVLLDRLLGAEVVRTEREDTDAVLEELAAAERGQGRRPYVIPIGGSNGVGTLGYVSMVLELSQQLFEAGHRVDRAYFSSGSGGTQAGLVLGARLYSAPYGLVGVSPGRKGDAVRAKVLCAGEECARLLGVEPRIAAEDLEVRNEFTGPAYSAPTPASQEATRLFAACDGIVLDPVYTAKAAAGLLHDIRSGRIGRDETVLFIHTGGTPALFAYGAEALGGQHD